MTNIFCPDRDVLGEGIFIDELNLYWVDIGRKRFKWSAIDRSFYHSIELDVIPTKVLSVDGVVAKILTNKGIAWLDLETEHIDIDHVDFGSNIRTNDGIVIKNGEILFGTMSVAARKGQGAIWSYKNGIYKKLLSGITIPNTFVALNDDEIVISDSYTGECDVYDISNNMQRIRKFMDLGPELNRGVPDGGFLSLTGYIYIAIWGESLILKLDQSGVIVEQYKVDAVQPTSCFIKKETLYVTTATEGLASIYDNSGMVLAVSL